MKYNKISNELKEKIENDIKLGWINPHKFNDEDVIRRNNSRDKANLWRSAFVRDTEKILHLPVYNRYADKTQVFSFYNNDDITRRALHVQLVSRIARNIGSVLGLNLELIEAIALGHDIGHTPFGHAGERFLSALLNNETGRYFNHNVHSVRVLDKIYKTNISLQTLDGILCHNGEFEQQEYIPEKLNNFQQFDSKYEMCYAHGKNAEEAKTVIDSLVPSTLEGCVVRICDMIAYLGKDRQDAIKARILEDDSGFSETPMGMRNAEIINNLTVDIIENSYGKDYILMSQDAYDSLKIMKKENYEKIYKLDGVNSEYEKYIKPMFDEMYYTLIEDYYKNHNESMLYKYHIQHIIDSNKYTPECNYMDEEINQVVVDYIASMTDDYFIALYEKIFGKGSSKINYRSYFEQ
ncbi:MAG: deoxyguanosinetriphosphate triphosphohydrolase family protein [Eubacterium sp.]